MPEGLVTISRVMTDDGKEISTQKAVDYGWINPGTSRQPAGWDLERHEIVVGNNLFLDNGRQVLCYAMGGRAPIYNYVISQFGVGTGISAARVTDVALEAPITLSTGLLKPIDAVDYLSAFVMRISFTLGLADANGYIISEMGLFSGGGAIIARKVRAVSINKNSSFSPVCSWRIRM